MNKSKTRVLVIITSSDRAGAQKHVEYLMAGPQTQCADFHVVTGGEGYLTEKCKEFDVPFSIVENLIRKVSFWTDIKALKSIYKLIQLVEPDLIHVHSAKAGTLGRIAGRIAKKPVVYTVHGWAFSEGNSFIKRSFSLLMERVLSRLTASYILVSQYDCDLGIKKRILKQDTNFSVIHNGIPNVALNMKGWSSSSPVELITVTRFAKQKNVKCMVKALSLLNGDVSMRILGYGPLEKDIKKEVSRLNLENVVTFRGEITDVTKDLNDSDVFVLSSDWEGLPIALIEAARAGLPMVATRVGGVPEIVSHDENGLLVERGDYQGLANAIQKLIDNPVIRKKQSLASRGAFEKKFNAEVMSSKTMNVYKKTLGA